MSYLEKEILGCLLKDNSLIEETEINMNQFESQAHQLIYQSIKKLSFEGKKADKVTLLADNYDYIAQLGGLEFITSLESNGNVDHFESYERQFIDQYKQRQSIVIAKEWLNKTNADTSDLMQDLQTLDEIGISDEIGKDEMLQQMANLPYVENAIDAGVPSGLKSLDDLTGGFQKQNSYILGARPSMGKTAVALKFAKSAMDGGVVPLIFSLEMSQESLLRRLIATIGKINLFFARNPHNLTKCQKESWTMAVNELYKHHFEVYDKPMQSIQYIRSRIRKAKNKHEGKDIIVIIDYLTLISSDSKYHSDHAKFTDISARLKAIAQDYDCPIITLAQLSRGVEQRNDKRPMLSDLRESGSIEQDADGVMFLYRDSYYNKGSESQELEIDMAKHRNGPTGTVTVYYNKATGIMGDLDGH